MRSTNSCATFAWPTPSRSNSLPTSWRCARRASASSSDRTTSSSRRCVATSRRWAANWRSVPASRTTRSSSVGMAALRRPRSSAPAPSASRPRSRPSAPACAPWCSSRARSCTRSSNYPTYMTFFTTSERLEIGGHPLVTATDKPTRKEALDYYRKVVAQRGPRRAHLHPRDRASPATATASRSHGAEGGAAPPSAPAPSCSPPATSTTPTARRARRRPAARQLPLPRGPPGVRPRRRGRRRRQRRGRRRARPAPPRRPRDDGPPRRRLQALAQVLDPAEPREPRQGGLDPRRLPRARRRDHARYVVVERTPPDGPPSASSCPPTASCCCSATAPTPRCCSRPAPRSTRTRRWPPSTRRPARPPSPASTRSAPPARAAAPATSSSRTACRTRGRRWRTWHAFATKQLRDCPRGATLQRLTSLCAPQPSSSIRPIAAAKARRSSTPVVVSSWTIHQSMLR
jgi:hypothetical protein